MSTNGIDFVIGGKDQAKPAMASVAAGLSQIETGTQSLKQATQSLLTTMKPLIALYAGVKAAMAAIGGVRAANEAFDAQADAVKRLNNAMAVRGDTATAEGIQQLAKHMERLTGVSDNVTNAVASQAAAMGFATDRIDDATTAATGLAAITGKTAGESLTDLKSALMGNFDVFQQLNPQIMFMRTNQEKLAAVMKIAEQGLLNQANNADSVAGSGKRASTALGNLLESVGALIAPFRVLISVGVEKLANTLTELLAPAVEWATNLLKNIGKVIQTLGIAWDYAIAATKLAGLQIIGSVKHTFTETIPAYLKWFGENFVNLMRDAWNGAITVVMNAGKIIGDMIGEIFNFIKSGGAGGLDALMAGLGKSAAQSLTEGFKSSLTALPTIADRQITDAEKELTKRVGDLGGKLKDAFNGKTAELKPKTLGDIALKGLPSVIMQGTSVTEGRLISRGPQSTIPQLLTQLLRTSQGAEKASLKGADAQEAAKQALGQIEKNTATQITLVGVA